LRNSRRSSRGAVFGLEDMPSGGAGSFILLIVILLVVLPVQNSLRTELSTLRGDRCGTRATLKLTATAARVDGGRWPGRQG